MTLSFIVLPFLIVGGDADRWSAVLLEASPSRGWVALVVFLLLAADIALPIPSSLVATAAGSLLGAVPAAAVIALGLSAGCLAGFALAARLGAARCREWVGTRHYERLSAALDRNGPIILAVCRPVPVLAEASILVAGLAGVSLGRSMLVATLSNVGIGLVYGTLGSRLAEGPSFLAAFAASCVVPSVAWGLARMVFAGPRESA